MTKQFQIQPPQRPQETIAPLRWKGPCHSRRCIEGHEVCSLHCTPQLSLLQWPVQQRLIKFQFNQKETLIKRLLILPSKKSSSWSFLLWSSSLWSVISFAQDSVEEKYFSDASGICHFTDSDTLSWELTTKILMIYFKSPAILKWETMSLAAYYL